MTDYYDEDGTVITKDMQEELFDQYLDELHDEVTIGDITFSPSKILAECDPIAYRCYASDYESAQIENGEWFEDDPTEDQAECEECLISLSDKEIYTKEPYIMCEDCYEEEYSED